MIIINHNNRSLVGLGYMWTVTFETNVGNQPLIFVNSLQLLGSFPALSMSTITTGLAPDNYQSMVVLSNSTSVVFPSLTTGVTWYFRVLASNDIGDSLLSAVVAGVPASSPLAPSSLSIEVTSDTLLSF